MTIKIYLGIVGIGNVIYSTFLIDLLVEMYVYGLCLMILRKVQNYFDK